MDSTVQPRLRVTAGRQTLSPQMLSENRALYR